MSQEIKEISYRNQRIITGRSSWQRRVYVVYADGQLKTAYCNILGTRLYLRKDGNVWRPK